jgi:hypothetical protein
MKKPRLKIDNEIKFGNYQDDRINSRLRKGRISSKLAIRLLVGGAENENI